MKITKISKSNSIYIQEKGKKDPVSLPELTGKVEKQSKVINNNNNKKSMGKLKVTLFWGRGEFNLVY